MRGARSTAAGPRGDTGRAIVQSPVTSLGPSADMAAAATLPSTSCVGTVRIVEWSQVGAIIGVLTAVVGLAVGLRSFWITRALDRIHATLDRSTFASTTSKAWCCSTTPSG